MSIRETLIAGALALPLSVGFAMAGEAHNDAEGGNAGNKHQAGLVLICGDDDFDGPVQIGGDNDFERGQQCFTEIAGGDNDFETPPVPTRKDAAGGPPTPR